MVATKSVIFAAIACSAAVEASVFKAVLGRDIRGTGDIFARADSPAKAPAKSAAASSDDIHAQIAKVFQGCKAAVQQLEKEKKPEPKVVKTGQDAVITGFPPICATEAKELKPKDPSFVIEVSATQIKLHNAPQSLLDKL